MGRIHKITKRDQSVAELKMAEAVIQKSYSNADVFYGISEILEFGDAEAVSNIKQTVEDALALLPRGKVLDLPKTVAKQDVMPDAKLDGSPSADKS